MKCDFCNRDVDIQKIESKKIPILYGDPKWKKNRFYFCPECLKQYQYVVNSTKAKFVRENKYGK